MCAEFSFSELTRLTFELKPFEIYNKVVLVRSQTIFDCCCRWRVPSPRHDYWAEMGGFPVRYIVRILASDMKIISYSDLHLEFPHKWSLPPDIESDILVLAGDIITFKNFTPLAALLQGWEKPVLFVAGNHEYYTRMPMQENEEQLRDWLSAEFPNVHFLRNEGITIDGINFFGGTMWTNFKSGNRKSMRYATTALNDFRYIWSDGVFTPEASIELHQQFVIPWSSGLSRSSQGLMLSLHTMRRL